MERCALCEAASREAVLTFNHVRQSERVTLDIALCESCATRLEKHLKRAIPKRLMDFDQVAVPRIAA